ncbi:permease [Rhizobium sp.]|uniref:permease n=2 Tax=unclassified Rhizobium TaxID=2613769 RepID=UPI000DD72359
MSSKEAGAVRRSSGRAKHARMFATFFSVAVVAGAFCYALRGPQAVVNSISDAWSELIALAVELVLGLVIASAVGILVPKNKVSRWLGENSGFRGLGIATALGMVTPGGPYASFPLVLSLSKAGADTGALIAFLTAWAASSVSRLLIWEIPMLGLDFAVLRFVVSIPLPFVAGFLAREIAARYRASGEQSHAG